MTQADQSKRIYPVPVKPASDIQTWAGWPDDVRDTLRAWNAGKGLSFTRSGVFKCEGCEEFCHSHPHGRAELKGVPYCDDCLIEKARHRPVHAPWNRGEGGVGAAQNALEAANAAEQVLAKGKGLNDG